MSSPDPGLTVVPRKRRGAELVLLLFAVVITLGAYAQVDVNVTGWLSPLFPFVAGGVALGALAAHFAVRWRIPYADPVLLPCVVLLNGLGLAMIHRIDLINNPPTGGARQQLIWTAVGVVLFILIAVLLRDHRPLHGYTYTFGLIGLVLMLLPLVPGLGTDKFGAQIWIQVGPLQLPARRGGEGAAGDRVRLVPGGEARRARAGRLPDHRHRPAPRAGPRARSCSSGSSACWC